MDYNANSSIKSFNVLGDKVFSLTSKNHLFIDGKFILEGPFIFYGTYQDLQIMFDQRNFQSVLLDKGGVEVMRIEEFAIRNIETLEDGVSLVGGNDGANIFYGFYDFRSKKLIKRFDNLGFNGVLLVWDENHFISRNREKFGLFTFENECVWEVFVKDLVPHKSGLGPGTPTITKVNEKLFVEYGKTFRLNPENGKIEETYEKAFTTSENEFLYGFQFQGIEVSELAILNTETNRIKLIAIRQEFKEQDVYPDWKIEIKEGMVYFSQNKGAHEAKLGLYDTQQEKILWKHVFEKENGMIGSLRISRERIVALTQDQTLHIFKKP